jgi:hypothetical protein
MQGVCNSLKAAAEHRPRVAAGARVRARGRQPSLQHAAAAVVVRGLQ